MNKIKALSVLFILLGACTGQSNKTVIRYMFWDSTYVLAFETMKKEFEAENPTIRVIGEVTPFSQYWAKIEAATIGKDLPDVFWMNFPNFPRFEKENLFYDWNDNYGELTNVIPSYPESIKSVYGKNGKYYAFPKGMDTVAVFLNKKLFEDTGVPIPSPDWSYEDFLDTANTLQGKLPMGSYAVAFTPSEQGGFEYFIYNNGGYLVSPDNTKHGLNLPGTAIGIEEYQKIVNGALTPDYNSLAETPIQVLFSSGRVAMITHISVHIAGFAKNPELLSNIITLPLPKIKGQNRIVLQAVGDTISYNSKNPEVAQKWIEFMNSPRGMQIQAEQGIFFPLMEPYATEFTAKYKVNMDAFKDINNTYSYPSVVEFNKYYELYNRTIRKIIEEDLDVRESLSNASIIADGYFK
ncbi:MAG: ABC transporter substrate-binding protein [Brevinema sp.]